MSALLTYVEECIKVIEIRLWFYSRTGMLGASILYLYMMKEKAEYDENSIKKVTGKDP